MVNTDILRVVLSPLPLLYSEESKVSNLTISMFVLSINYYILYQLFIKNFTVTWEGWFRKKERERDTVLVFV